MNFFIFPILFVSIFESCVQEEENSFPQNFTPSDEKQILIQFFSETIVSPWKTSTGWLKAFSNHCQWFGISCDSQGFVQEIKLENNQLTGTLPSCLQFLKHLEVLSLSENSLEGEISLTVFSQMTQLKTLELSHNLFSSLKIETSFSESGLKELTQLNLSSNFLESIEVPLEWSSVFGKNLTTLDLSNNLLETVPSSFLENLETLQELDLSGNKNFEPSSKLWELKTLRKLSLKSVKIQDLSQVNKLSLLEELDLSQNDLKTFPKTVLDLNQTLRSFEISANSLGEIPSEINQLKKLELLNLINCNLKSLPVLDLPKLRNLEVMGNIMESIDLSNLKGTLEKLLISVKKVSPGSLSEFTNLEELWITSQTIYKIPDLPMSLKHFVIDQLEFDEWPTEFYEHEFPNLWKIGFWRQGSRVPFPDWIFSQGNNNTSCALKEVSIDGKFFGTIPSSIGKVKNCLKAIVLQNTQMDGSVPTEIGLLTNLERLEIINNKLTGSLPSEIENLSNLKRLIVVDNQFSTSLNTGLSSLSTLLETCTLKQEPQFQCSSEKMFSDEKICDVNCQSLVSFKGNWVNEDFEVCKKTRTGSLWNVGKVSIDGNKVSTMIRFVDGCPEGTPLLVAKFEGTVEAQNITQLSEDEFEILVKFHHQKQLIYIYSFKTQNYLNVGCGWSFPINKWEDVSSTSCLYGVGGVNLDFQDLNLCPNRFDKWFVNFKNSSLKVVGGSFYALSTITTCELSDLGENYFPIELRRDWNVGEEENLETWKPVCGDGVRLRDENCDDGGRENGDGCSSSCKTEVGWNCSSVPKEGYKSICQPICGDKRIVSEDDCDFKTGNDNNNNKEFTVWLSVLIVCVVLLIFVVFVVWYLKKSKELEKSSPTINSVDLKLISLIGEGGQSQVFKGVWRENTEVAVKVVKDIGKDSLRSFSEEASLLVRLRPHPNIVQFLGICFNSNTQKSSHSLLNLVSEQKEGQKAQIPNSQSSLSLNMMIVTEYLSRGSLYNFMNDEFKFVDLETPPENLDYLFVIELGKGITAGMDHLHKNNIIHKDLACRNILLGSRFTEDEGREGVTKMVPKISDFGLSSSNTKEKRIPTRWSAPEVLLKYSHSFSSDVWSFGIVLFEISTACAFFPYPNLSGNSKVREAVLSGFQLNLPSYCSVEYNSLFKACLSMNSELRPTFSQLHKCFLKEERDLTEFVSDLNPSIEQSILRQTNRLWRSELRFELLSSQNYLNENKVIYE